MRRGDGVGFEFTLDGLERKVVMMPFTWKLRLLKNRRFNILWQHWQRFRGRLVGNYEHLPQYIREHAPGRTFADIGCMWGVNGRYSFLAEEAGATAVKALDVFGPTPEFEAHKEAVGSSVEFLLGDVTDAAVIERVGVVDVVFCSGVLYHHPSPFDVLVALRRICRQTLILRTYAIPEMLGFRNGAVYFPYLDDHERKLWDLTQLGVCKMVGVTNPFQPNEGYGNFFWGLTPSCLVSLLSTAGFEVVTRATEVFAQTVVCRPVEIPFAHVLPSEHQARAMAALISKTGNARPC